MDLHLHTPASSDYQEPGVSYLDILHRAETRGLNIIGFADHNTVAGYRKMLDEIEQLHLLRSLKRILPEEEQRLKEYERLRAKVLVLPGFEFTATFGFHIMGLFAPDKPLREIKGGGIRTLTRQGPGAAWLRIHRHLWFPHYGPICARQTLAGNRTHFARP